MVCWIYSLHHSLYFPDAINQNVGSCNQVVRQGFDGRRLFQRKLVPVLTIDAFTGGIMMILCDLSTSSEAIQVGGSHHSSIRDRRMHLYHSVLSELSVPPVHHWRLLLLMPLVIMRPRSVLVQPSHTGLEIYGMLSCFLARTMPGSFSSTSALVILMAVSHA